MHVLALARSSTTRALRPLLLAAVFVIAAVIAGPAAAHHGASLHCGEECVKVPFLFDKKFVSSPAKTAGGQASEEWEGTAPVADPLGLGFADIREFTVQPGNDSLAVEIRWDPGFALAYDMDLYIERRTELGTWQQVGDSTNGQALGDGEAVELAVVQSPVPGTYRTRVVNWASTTFDYQGQLWFTGATKPKGGSGGGGGKTSSGRATADRPDIVTGSKIHVIYFVPSDAVDGQLDLNGVLEDSVASMNVFLRGDIGRGLRLDTYLDRRTPRLDITFVRGERTASEYSQDPDEAFAAVTDELERRGFNESGAVKRYFVYYEGPASSANVCGTAYVNIAGGFAQWSVVWLGASPGCGARDFGTPETGGGMSEAIALHENFHNEGMVPLTAPRQCWAFYFHLCSAGAGAAVSALDPENVDLMFPFVTFPLRDKTVDRNHDDYYNHGLPYRDMADSPFWDS